MAAQEKTWGLDLGAVGGIIGFAISRQWSGCLCPVLEVAARACVAAVARRPASAAGGGATSEGEGE